MGKQRATDSDVPYSATKETTQVRKIIIQSNKYVIILVLL
jgi:hypothetical protein